MNLFGSFSEDKTENLNFIKTDDIEVFVMRDAKSDVVAAADVRTPRRPCHMSEKENEAVLRARP